MISRVLELCVVTITCAWFLYLRFEITGVSGLVNVKVNPYQTDLFTCVVQGNPPPSEQQVRLFQVSGKMYNQSGIDQVSSVANYTERAVVFQVDSVVPGDYNCTLYAASSSASMDYTAETYGESRDLYT